MVWTAIAISSITTISSIINSIINSTTTKTTNYLTLISSSIIIITSNSTIIRSSIIINSSTTIVSNNTEEAAMGKTQVSIILKISLKDRWTIVKSIITIKIYSIMIKIIGITMGMMVMNKTIKKTMFRIYNILQMENLIKLGWNKATKGNIRIDKVGTKVDNLNW